MKLQSLWSGEIGGHYEASAAKYLEARGLKLVTKNYRSRFGEIDLIMRDNRTLTFVEVKYRSGSQFGNAAEMVTYQKQQKILKTAALFLQSYSQYADFPCRFDVVAITASTSDSGIRTSWIKNAFLA